MSESKGSALKPLVTAVLVAAIVLPAGYYGFHLLNGQQSQTHSVIMELKSETLQDIQSTSAKTADELKKLNEQVSSGGMAGGGEKIAAELEALKQMTTAIQAQQKSMSDGLSKLLGQQGGMAPGTAGAISDATLTETIYFKMAKSGGPDIDKHVAAIVPKMKAQLAKGPCQVDVTGFADTLGNDLSNLKLSNERADYVAGQLRSAGIEVYSVEAWGERRLKINTYDGVNNENNRRAVVEMHCGPKPAKAAGT
jgi:outer membrane protein OmpA-like peptidoglycan-associated protein